MTKPSIKPSNSWKMPAPYHPTPIFWILFPHRRLLFRATFKQITGFIRWKEEARSLAVSLATFLTDPEEALALGGDCATNPPVGGWNPPVLFASDTINPGKFNTLDALQKIVYLGGDHVPYLYIADTRNTILGDNHNNNPSLVTFANSFNTSGKTIDAINDIDTYKDLANGKVYAFATTASATAQLVVLDVTDIHNPVIAQNAGVPAKRTLYGVNPLGSYPEGWRVYYYDKKIYLTTRETDGPEFHIFDASDPTNPTELGNKELNTTVNDFTVRDGLAYFADDSDARGELLIYDVSNPLVISEIVGARGDFPGNTNGESLFLLGNKLYFGRQKTPSAPEFYILDASSPRTAVGGLPIIGLSDPNKDMGTDITNIRVAGSFAFIATYANSSGGFKVWDISNPLDIQSINLTFNFGNKPVAIDYDSNFVYAGGESTPNFQMLYSP